ncbi:two-component regulator propeller domain-containing protein [Mucilaginibacter terrae]|uniref:histidine kinase n=1 Tax=Mucilaginibacter terrae TaxID=1955052 RepID=A0ABU3GN21_9SPHI|nr:two-component regulator propeller domain-containing protein [Mucilaginibacter terrae]MDT3401177.1 signal transduction histidine kinase/ligand-binding sensor domain-containing protein/CheY-like chemotaxis protein/AraC-like DNA-binding protein [Mucilaginibacter terrae]
MGRLWSERTCSILISTIRNIVKIALAFLIIFFPNDLKGQANKLAVEQIGIQHGLSNNEVRCIFKDHTGYLWFGTYDGLNRYDGYTFKIFRNNPNQPQSISDSWINCIGEDNVGRMWAGTRHGVNVLDPRSETFKSLTASQARDTTQVKITTNISDIKRTQDDRMLVGTDGQGLAIFDNKKSTGGEFLPLLLGSQLNYGYSVSKVSVGVSGEIFVIVKGQGLYQLDNRTLKFRLLNDEIRVATSMVQQGRIIWVGNNAGLHRYCLNEKRYDLHLNENHSELSSNRVTSILPVNKSELWIATDGGGIDILDLETGRIKVMTNGSDRFSLTSNAVYSLYMDDRGRKWIATLRGGINVIDESKNRFQNLVHDLFNANSLISDFIKSVFEDSKGNVWIGTDGGGLSIWDRRSGNFTNYRHQPHAINGLNSNFITSILEDNKGRIWIATYGGGIDRYDINSRSFIHYNGYDPTGSAKGVVMWSIFQDRHNGIWVSGLQDGLYKFSERNDRFELLKTKPANTLCFAEDSRGGIWTGTFDGIYQLGSKNDIFYPLNATVRTIHPEHEKGLWVGTEKGLMFFDSRSKKVTMHFTTDDGLSNNTVLAIEADKGGNLWLATYNGLNKFNIKSHKFNGYYRSDGLLNREYNYNASAHLRDGHLAFGGINGLTLFQPEAITPDRARPNLVITDMAINNKHFTENLDHIEFNGQRFAGVNIPFDKASLNVSFAAIEFSAQDRIKYRYQMDGWDRGWNYTKNSRTATYTHLDPGNYTLRLNCTDAEGRWVKEEIRVRVKVTPPWYFSWTAMALYFFVASAGVYWYIGNRFKQNRLKYEIGIAKAKADYQEAMQLKDKEQNERQLEFFTGIAHEFRTPLSLIINPLADFLKVNSSTETKELVTVFRNAKRLLRLVDQLLLFRKTETKIPAMAISHMDVIELCEDVLGYFEEVSKTQNLNLRFITYDDLPQVYGDRERIEIILFNLVSNAVKYTPPGGAVSLEVEEQESYIEFRVTDTGPGIPEDVGKRIFEKYFRHVENGKRAKSGFGIGLHIAQRFAQDHYGQLDFTSRENGTTFRLMLKKGFSHFEGVEVLHAKGVSSGLLTELSEGIVREEIQTNYAPENIALITDKKSVLLVDDDEELRNYLKGLLEQHYIVFRAASGEEGLVLAREKRPDLIICDVMMSGISGVEVCEQIKSTEALSYIPFILLTASTAAQMKLDGLKKGADDYIYKPFDSEILLARVSNLLHTRSNLQKYFYNAITLKTDEIAISEEYKLFLEKCIEVVESHLTDPDFNVGALCKVLGMSHSNLFRKVKSLSGYSINNFIRFIRLRKAAELLIQTDMNINEVVVETGFNDLKYFRTHFVKLFNMTPSDFMKTNRPLFKKRFNLTK